MDERREPPRWRRLGWFVLLWVGGVGAVMLVASLLKLVMAGLPS